TRRWTTDGARVRRRPLAAAGLGLLLGIAVSGASAQDFPARPIKLLVGFSAGGGLDISCRYWAQRLSARTGQPVVVEDRPGDTALAAWGEPAAKRARPPAPDGYPLVSLPGSNTISSSKPTPPFDIRTDVTPVIQMTRFTFVLYVNPAVPVKTVGELVAYAKA